MRAAFRAAWATLSYTPSSPSLITPGWMMRANLKSQWGELYHYITMASIVFNKRAKHRA